MLISSQGFLEYVDAVLLDERTSLNNPHIFNFLYTFFPKVRTDLLARKGGFTNNRLNIPNFSQVANQVLTDHVQHIISQLARNFIEVADSFNLTRVSPLRHLNGDLRSLILVNTAKTDHLTSELMDSLVTLRTKVQKMLDYAAKESCHKSDSSSDKKDDLPPTTAKKRLFEESKSDGVSESGSSKRCRTSVLDEGESSKIPKPGPSSTPGPVERDDGAKSIPENSRMKDTLNVFMKTLNILVRMCETAFCSDDEQSDNDNENKRKRTKKTPSPIDEEKDQAS